MLQILKRDTKLMFFMTDDFLHEIYAQGESSLGDVSKGI